MKHVHFIGAGGSGLSSIATVLLQRGWSVSGSDRQASAAMDALGSAGARLYYGHAGENIIGADLVVRSSAVQDDNPEVVAARLAGIPVLKRRDFLGELLEGQDVIAIAGTHGKTTTTAMTAWVLTVLGLDPSFVIGGVSVNLGASAAAGSGRYFVIEADEYDRMFLGIQPTIALVTNIEHDHPDCFPTPADFETAFRDFGSGILPGGALIACADDAGAAALLADCAGQVDTVAYGIGDTGLDFSAENVRPNGRGGSRFDVCKRERLVLRDVELQVPGRHNVRNALAVLAAVERIGAPLDEAVRALEEFSGTARRFQLRGEALGVALVDDFAHHPTEIRATLEAARERFAERRLWAVWQPHTYSRTRALQADFIAAFDAADSVLVTEVYAAREAPPPGGYSSAPLAEAIGERRGNAAAARFAVDFDSAVEQLLEQITPGDVVLVLSAGDATQITSRLERELSRRSRFLDWIDEEGDDEGK